MFGTSEATAFWVMFGIQIANATLLFLITKRVLGLDAAVFAAFVWFTLPVIVDFGYLVANHTFAIPPTLAAILFLVRYTEKVGSPRLNLLFGCASMAAAVLSSWEPVLMALGLCAIVILLKIDHLRAPAVAYGVTAAGTAVCILAWYGFIFPEIAKNLFHVALFRAGMAESKIIEFNIYDFLVGRHESATTLGHQLAVFVDRLRMLGMFGVIAVGSSLLGLLFQPSDERGRSLWFTTFALSALWLLWALVMRQHYVIHNFEMLMAAPLTAFASGILIARLLQHVRSWVNGYHRRIALLVLLVVLPIAMVLDLSRYAQTINAISPNVLSFRDVNYGIAIRNNTPVDAVVIATTASMVPVYYSERHIIRAVEDETVLKEVFPAIADRSGTRPIYLALLPILDSGHFPNATRNLTPVYEGTDLLLFSLREGTSGIGGSPVLKNRSCL
jgi:hypothetical protein